MKGKHERLERLHVRRKNSPTCHTTGRVSYWISKQPCEPTEWTAGRLKVDSSQSSATKTEVRQIFLKSIFYSLYCTLFSTLKTQLCPEKVLSSQLQLCVHLNLTKKGWRGTSSTGSWPPITSAATCWGKRLWTEHHSGPATPGHQEPVTMWSSRMLCTQETWRLWSNFSQEEPQQISS